MKRAAIAIGLLLCTFLFGQAAFQYVTGTKKHPAATNPKPAKGQTSADSAFHVPVQRITDLNADKYARPGITNEYSRSDPVNADGTRLVLSEPQTGSWVLYNNLPPFNKLKKLPLSLGGDIEPRWDPVDPFTVYAFRGPQFVSVDIRNNHLSVIYNFKNDFASAEFAGTGSEGEPSQDLRWWTILVKNANGRPLEVVVYDKNNRTIVSRKTAFEYNLDQVEINWVSTCPISGDPILGWVFRPETDPFGSQHRGAIRYDKAWKKIADTMADGHCDVAVGKNNEELLVYQNNATDYVDMVNLATGVRTPLFKIPFPFAQGSDLNLHFSGNILSTSPRKGWALVVGDELNNRNNSWLSNQIALVELKSHPRIWRLAFNHNLYSGEYFTECFATLTHDGKYVYFQSNWGNATPFSGAVGVFTEEYRLNLPADWQQHFGIGRGAGPRASPDDFFKILMRGGQGRPPS